MLFYYVRYTITPTITCKIILNNLLFNFGLNSDALVLANETV